MSPHSQRAEQKPQRRKAADSRLHRHAGCRPSGAGRAGANFSPTIARICRCSRRTSAVPCSLPAPPSALPLCANFVTTRLLALGGAPDAFAQILTMGAVMLAILAVQVAAVFFVDYQGHVMGAKIEAALRQELFEHCQKLSFSFYDRQRTGQLMSRITNDSLWLGELFHHGPEDLSIAVLKFLRRHGGAVLHRPAAGRADSRP